MNCTLCQSKLTERNTAVFDCGHSFHLSCVVSHQGSLCLTCENNSDHLPDVGLDREVAIRSNLASKIRLRQLQPVPETSFLSKVQRMLTPLTPQATCFSDHVYHNKKLTYISTAGFEPKDAIQERIKWSDIATRYKSQDILDFGFNWSQMVTMGLTPRELQLFSWSQQARQLELTAAKILQLNISVSELAAMKYSTHQLVELGFTWQVMASIGATVETWRSFGFKLEDLKRYWQPTLTQWVSAGFYDKDRLTHAGWDIEDVLHTLPSVESRSSGRMLRLAF